MSNNSEEKSKNILIADDEKDIRGLVAICLKKEGYNVLEAENGQRAVELVKENKDIDIIIMDIMMPGMSGVDACREIRKFSSVPVLFLTAKTQENDKNEAYDTGGDDFLSKPFPQNELSRKVKALIRRYNEYSGKDETGEETLRIADVVVDTNKRVVFKGAEPIHLTEKEYALFCFMIKNRGITWSLTDLYENIWKEKYLPSSSNTVMVHILRLRQKIEDNPAHPEIIRTIYGKGYQID